MPKEIVIATSNVHKAREIRAILDDLPDVTFRTLQAFPDYVSPEETGTTFEANARLKAVHAVKVLGCPVLADDSGLVVPALEGAPGVYSARYAGMGASDRDNRKKLLEAMRGFEGEQRHAYFICVLVLATPHGKVMVVEAKCEGVVTESERGSNGHGYDAVFAKHDYPRTFAQLDEAIKNRISHRRKALDKMRLQMESHALLD